MIVFCGKAFDMVYYDLIIYIHLNSLKKFKSSSPVAVTPLDAIFIHLLSGVLCFCLLLPSVRPSQLTFQWLSIWSYSNFVWCFLGIISVFFFSNYNPEFFYCNFWENWRLHKFFENIQFSRDFAEIWFVGSSCVVVLNNISLKNIFCIEDNILEVTCQSF